MAGLFQALSSMVFGSNSDDKIKALVTKLDKYECEHTRLMCKNPDFSTPMSIYSLSRVTFKYDKEEAKFYVSVEALADVDEDEESEILLPITKDFQWKILETDDDADYRLAHEFDYSKHKEKDVGDGIYLVEFLNEALSNTVDKFEDYINEILDIVEGMKQVGFII
jgi:hypothetical protein